MQSILITGTKGKTTTLFILDSILRGIGKNTLCVNSEGVFKNGKLIKGNTYFLKKYKTSANVVAIKELSEDDLENIDYLLLECSYANAKNLKNSFLRKKIDIGILTNVYTDHIDGNKVKDRSDLLQRKVDVMLNIKRNGKALVFAGDCRSSIAFKAINMLNQERSNIEILRYARGKFSKDQRVDYYLENSFIKKGNKKILNYKNTELAFKYLHRPTDVNLVLVSAVLDLLGINPEIINTSKSLNNIVPGRLNLFSDKNHIVILDYAHEIQSLRAAAKLLREKYKGKKIVAVARFSYHRNARTIKKMTTQIAPIFDSFIVYDKAISRPGLRRVFTEKFGFNVGEVAEIMSKVLQEKGVPVMRINNELEAIKCGIKNLSENEVLYIMGDQIKKDITLVRKTLSL